MKDIVVSMTSPNVSSSAGTNAVIENVVACAASNTVASKRRKRAVGGDYEYAITAIGGSATGGGSESESTATGSESESTATGGGSESESTAAEGGSESGSTSDLQDLTKSGFWQPLEVPGKMNTLVL